MPRWPGFVGGSNQPQSLLADCERTVNLYVEQVDSSSKEFPAALFPTPGFKLWGRSGGEVGTRALRTADGRLFAVIGTAFGEFSNTGIWKKWGTVPQDANPAQLVYNGKVGGQLGIASGGSIYSFALGTNAFAGPHFGAVNCTMLAFAESFGLAFDGLTGRVYLSSLNDLTAWSLGTFFQRSKFPDPWKTMFVDTNSLIWLIGTETFEVWYDTGTGSQPWAPLSGLFGRHGIAAPFAFGVSNTGLYWLSTSPEGGTAFVNTRGGAPQVVSSYSVASAIAGYRRTARVDDAELMIYADQGHTFVNVTFPSAPATWTLDAVTQQWAERGRWDSVNKRYDLWAPRVHADCFGKHLAGDRTTGTIWEMDTELTTDVDGQGIRRLRRAPALVAEGKQIPMDQIQLFMDVGVAGQGLDPQVMLRISEDGGRTWGNERTASYGRIGEYRRRVTWPQCGASADAVAEVTWSDAAPVRVVDAFLNNAAKVA